MITDKTDIRLWYYETYPTDTEYYKIARNITFKELFNHIESKGSFYGYIGTRDKLIKSRILYGLSQYKHIDYYDIQEKVQCCREFSEFLVPLIRLRAVNRLKEKFHISGKDNFPKLTVI